MQRERKTTKISRVLLDSSFGNLVWEKYSYFLFHKNENCESPFAQNLSENGKRQHCWAKKKKRKQNEMKQQ